jgi:hypothetical protein
MAVSLKHIGKISFDFDKGVFRDECGRTGHRSQRSESKRAAANGCGTIMRHAAGPLNSSVSFLMRTEIDKAQIELVVFARFVRLSGLPVQENSIQKRRPPEPDILCELQSQGQIAFELAEACVPEFAQAIAIGAQTGAHDATWGSAWLNPSAANLSAQYAILDDRERPYYEHRLAA